MSGNVRGLFVRATGKRGTILFLRISYFLQSINLSKKVGRRPFFCDLLLPARQTDCTNRYTSLLYQNLTSTSHLPSPACVYLLRLRLVPSSASPVAVLPEHPRHVLSRFAFLSTFGSISNPQTQHNSPRIFAFRTNRSIKMIVMEGLMLVPPERGTIIGRAIWKVGLLWHLSYAPLSNQT